MTQSVHSLCKECSTGSILDFSLHENPFTELFIVPTWSTRSSSEFIMMPYHPGCREHLKFIFLQPMQQYKLDVTTRIFWKESVSHALTHLCLNGPCCCLFGWVVKTGGI